MNLHVILHHGRNTHHISEAVFKAAARALRDAFELDPRCDRRSLDQGDALSERWPDPDRHRTRRSSSRDNRSLMTTPTRHSRLGLVVNAALVALAFGLLGLVIWQNRGKIRKVFSRPLDLRLLALGPGDLPDRHDRHLRALVFPGPGDRAASSDCSATCCWASSASSSTW